jgi:hypothetical protein
MSRPEVTGRKNSLDVEPVLVPVEPLLVSINDSLKLIPISRASFYRYLEDGIVPSVKIGGRRFVPLDALKRIAREGIEIETTTRRVGRPRKLAAAQQTALA